MKQLLLFILIAGVISGCGKSNNADDSAPVASFKITNTVEEGVIIESTTLQIQNNSRNADSYEWDFGDGIVSSDRTPAGIVYRQCPIIREIRLTVRTRTGRTHTIVQTIRVRCR